MYMNDVIDILGIDGERGGSSSAKKPAKIKKSPKKGNGKKNTVDYVKQLLPDDMGINVHDLVNQIGEAPQNHLEMSFKKFGKKPVRKWFWGEFNNSARTDGLLLHHWKRVGVKPIEYPFAVLNKRETMPTYSDAEYNVLMDVSEIGENNWTKAETDYLVRLVDEYHGIWTVIHDRYNFYSGPSRSLDDLRARFHLIDDASKFLHNNKGPASDYNFDEEIKRKQQLKCFILRTSEQLEEEEFIVKELDRIRKQDREFRISKRHINIEKMAKLVASQRIKKRAILTARRGPLKAANSSRRMLSPRMDLTAPGGVDFEIMAAFGLSTKPIKKVAFGNGWFFASEAAGVSFGQHITKQSLIQAVYNYYMSLTLNPLIFSMESADSSTEFRSKIHCISELKGAFTSLVSELTRLQEFERASGFESEPLAPEHSVRHYMKDRLSKDGKRSYESLFHIIPPTFPIAGCMKLNNNGVLIRNSASMVVIPKELARTRRSSTGPIASERQRLSPVSPTKPASSQVSKRTRDDGRYSSPPVKKAALSIRSEALVRASDIGAPPMTVLSPRADGRPSRGFRPKTFFSPNK